MAVPTQNYKEIIMGEFDKRFSPGQIRHVLENAVERGFSVMQDATPVRTGALKNSQGWGLVSDTSAEMHADASYAAAVNNGTSRQSPQPYFERGVATALQRLQENLKAL
jgi:hypothetical protein